MMAPPGIDIVQIGEAPDRTSRYGSKLAFAEFLPGGRHGAGLLEIVDLDVEEDTLYDRQALPNFLMEFSATRKHVAVFPRAIEASDVCACNGSDALRWKQLLGKLRPSW